ncbi:hypothetical protein ACSBR2_027167 [Camellia fascicularis]
MDLPPQSPAIDSLNMWHPQSQMRILWLSFPYMWPFNDCCGACDYDPPSPVCAASDPPSGTTSNTVVSCETPSSSATVS